MLSKLDYKHFILLLTALYFIYSNYQGFNEKRSYIEAIEAKDLEIKYHRDKNGNLIAEKRAMEVTLEEAKDLNLFKDKKIKNLRNLVSHTEVKTITRDSLVTRLDTLVLNDTIEYYTFRYKDKWLNLDGRITDSVSLKYSIYEEFDVTAIRKAPKFYKRKLLVVDVNSKNPNSLVSNIQSIQIKEPKKKFYETKTFAFIAGAFVGVAIK